MTSLNTTVRPLAGTDLGRPATEARSSTRPAAPLLAVALAASFGGAVLGAAAATAVPALTRDPAAEHARLLVFAERMEQAAKWDDRWQQMHPEPR